MIDNGKPKLRGGSHSAKAHGWVTVCVHLDRADHAALTWAARSSGLTLKEFCRLAALKAAGIDAEPRPDGRGRKAGAIGSAYRPMLPP